MDKKKKKIVWGVIAAYLILGTLVLFLSEGKQDAMQQLQSGLPAA